MTSKVVDYVRSEVLIVAKERDIKKIMKLIKDKKETLGVVTKFLNVSRKDPNQLTPEEIQLNKEIQTLEKQLKTKKMELQRLNEKEMEELQRPKEKEKEDPPKSPVKKAKKKDKKDKKKKKKGIKNLVVAEPKQSPKQSIVDLRLDKTAKISGNGDVRMTDIAVVVQDNPKGV
jgi:hypothetical protein